MFDVLARLADAPTDDRRRCGCQASAAGATLSIDATDCEHGGALARSPACRGAAVDALDGRSVETIATRDGGRAREYRETGPGLLSAAAGFAAAVDDREPRLARRARRDPLAAAREAVGRADAPARVAADAGLDRFAGDGLTYDRAFRPVRGLAASTWRIDPTPPGAGTLAARRTLDTGATVRVYDLPDRGTRQYHLEPVEAGFDDAAVRLLDEAHERLATTTLGDRDRAATRAVRQVAGGDDRAPRIAAVLRKHCHEGGLLRDLFADPALSDVFVTAPASRNPIRVRVDGETLDTNVTVGDDGVAALASRFRRESGRGFSRARPTLDAATTIGDRRVRVAGVTEPVSEGEAFALRAHDRDVWTLPALVANDTLSPAAAGLLSVCVERGAATLLAGPRGSGKTTTLGALLWELPPRVRTVLIEDAPELPARALQEAGRDVQALRAADDDALTPVEALRSALRLGDGALVVGEVRGEEAGVLYEAMRVGANSEAVLGTIHGADADEVFERVVSDLGVPASSFATTDLVVSLETAAGETGPERRVRAVEEVRAADPVAFAPLFERTDAGLQPTGRIDRGNSRLVERLTRPDETYAALRTVVQARADQLGQLASRGRTAPEDVTAARTRRGRW